MKIINEGTHLNIESYIPYKKAKDIALKHEIPLKYSHPKVIEGWMNKPKGIMQILFERGFVDGTLSVNDYTEKGLKNRNGPIDTSIKFKDIISNLPDFVNEQSRLQYFANKLGVTVKSSPKYHPEIAGEGIEYCWGLSKGWYRKQSLSLKKNKQGFYQLVTKSMDPSTVLDVYHVRMCVRRQRSYILAYLCMYRDPPSRTTTVTLRASVKLCTPNITTSDTYRPLIHQPPRQ